MSRLLRGVRLCRFVEAAQTPFFSSLSPRTFHLEIHKDPRNVMKIQTKLFHATVISLSKKGKRKKPASVDDLLDELNDGEDEQELEKQKIIRQRSRSSNSPAAKFISTGGKSAGGGGKKEKGLS